MDSRREIDFWKLNKESSSKMVKQLPEASEMFKWPFSTRANHTFFQNHVSSNWNVVHSSDPRLQLNNKKISKAESYFGSGDLHETSTTFPLPSLVKTASSRNDISNHSTLTIFYSGEVYIFPHVSPEKAEYITRIAAEGMDLSKMSKFANKENKSEPSTQNSEYNYANRVLVMARKATLARFLEKRKHRMINVRPYQCDEKSGKCPFDQQEETASSGGLWES